MTNPRIRLDARSIRDALSRIEETSQESLAPPPKRTLYMPPGHVKALSLSSSVVVGMRGTGKSYWTAALASTSHRKHIAKAARLPELGSAIVNIGFALDPSSEEFPTAALLAKVVEEGADPRDVWYSVILRHALKAAGKALPVHDDWESLIRWFARNGDKGLALLAQCDRQLAQDGTHLIVLFDALDRLAQDWNGIRSYLRALLVVCLECRSRRSIRLKVFMRPDMEEDEAIWDFVDSSKLRASKVELVWRPFDLFGLVLLNLANDADAGESFREEVTRVAEVSWVEADGAYLLPRIIANGEQPARSIIEAFSGAWVGKSAKRGYVYTWIPTHLADAKGRLSPRSFLLAFRAAAEWTETYEPEHPVALHFKGIQQGVAKASEIRVGEISEDYPWVKPLLEAAQGLTVPCEVSDLTDLWPKQLAQHIAKATAAKLPPRRFVTDPIRKYKTDALIEDLVELAILYRTGDDRLNIPDICRVGFGIKRMGGVRPPR